MSPNQEKSNKEQSTENLVNSLVAAGTSGLAGAYASFFFEGVKKRLQSNQSLPQFQSNMLPWIRESFRGSGSFACSLVPTSMIQQMAHQYFSKQNSSNEVMETIFSGALGGFASTVVENIVLQQQLKKFGPKEAFSDLISQGKTRIFRGLPLIMTREAFFGFSYMQGAKEAANYATTHYGPAFALPAKLMVGALGSLVSHPFDTVATTMQHKGYRTAGEAIGHLWAENKVKAFYKGGFARIGLFTTAMLTIDTVQNSVLNHLNDQPASAPKIS